jgi:hypothetical protein
MQTYLPLLILLACPLMMIFMMRGMTSGHDSGPRSDHPANAGKPDARDERLAELEREVAELRAARDHTRTSRP